MKNCKGVSDSNILSDKGISLNTKFLSGDIKLPSFHFKFKNSGDFFGGYMCVWQNVEAMDYFYF